MTKTTTTYTLPPEPDGPVWDRFGKRWSPTDVDGLWIHDVTGVPCTWARVLEGYGPLSLTPPWKPDVGGIVETREQYRAMPAGSIVESSSGRIYRRTHAGEWLVTGSSITQICADLAGTPRTILRVGWSL